MRRRENPPDLSFKNPYVIALGAVAGGIILAAAASRAGTARSAGVPGTIFTIVLENHSLAQVSGSSSMPYLNQLFSQYGQATNYHSRIHPSLPNYLLMTSGQTWGIEDDYYHLIPGTENLFAQMDAAGIPWRSYSESMGQPCRTSDGSLYASRHNPAVYYDSVVGDQSSCSTKVVDFSNIWTDLAADTLRYMWITPNLMNDLHDGTLSQGDAWLAQVVPQLMASPGYQRGGAIFILTDEGEGGSGDPSLLPIVVVSQNLRSLPMADNTRYDHRSYLAGVQDLLGLPRLASTTGVTSMASMFSG